MRLFSRISCRYNIKLFGAVGDGLHNDTDAILAALRAAQQTVNYSSILVPEGRYLMWPVHLESCRNMYIEVEVQHRYAHIALQKLFLHDGGGAGGGGGGLGGGEGQGHNARSY